MTPTVPSSRRSCPAEGSSPPRIVIVGDRLEELKSALGAGLEADLCVVSGGLGPTHDDRTVEVLAGGTGALVVDAALQREIEASRAGSPKRLERPYADFSAGVTKQASLPEGAVSLGLAGTAPAVLLEHDRSVFVASRARPASCSVSGRRPLRTRLCVLSSRARTPREHRVVRLLRAQRVRRRAGARREAGGEAGSR